MNTPHFNNFHDATDAVFTPCERPAREPDFISGAGSEYWDTGEGVIRYSDHWCLGIRSCNWLHTEGDNGQWKAGFCKYADFVPRYNPDDRTDYAVRHHPAVAAIMHASRERCLRNQIDAERESDKLSAGHRITAKRTYKVRIGQGRWARYRTEVDRVSCRVLRRTGHFVDTSLGRFALHTLSEIELIRTPDDVYSNDDH